MERVRSWIDEWRARRRGSRFVSRDIGRSARHIIGPTGNGFSNAWDVLAETGDSCLKSFDRRIPPSIHVSERDRTRWNMPIPISERCIEDWNASAPVDDLAAGDLEG